MTCCSGFSSREELIYDFVRKNSLSPDVSVERTKAFLLRGLPYLDRGVLSREEFLDNLFRISHARIAPEDFWPAYDAYIAHSTKQKGGN